MRDLKRIKNIEEPRHYLSHSMPLSSFDNICELSEEDAYKYLRGEVLRDIKEDKEGNIVKDGWVILAYEGLALGWGKSKDGTIKNHYPKGLRNLQ